MKLFDTRHVSNIEYYYDTNNVQCVVMQQMPKTS